MATKTVAVASSTAGVHAPIGSWQSRHRPRSSAYDSSGTPSRTPMPAPHDSQANGTRA